MIGIKDGATNAASVFGRSSIGTYMYVASMRPASMTDCVESIFYSPRCGQGNQALTQTPATSASTHFILTNGPAHCVLRNPAVTAKARNGM